MTSPTLDKTYSRENVSAGTCHTGPLTPEATDLGGGSDIHRPKSADSAATARKASISRKETLNEDGPSSLQEINFVSPKEAV